MNETFRKIFGSDYLYCMRNSTRPFDDSWKCIGGFDSYMDADKYSPDWNTFQGQTILIHVPNILPDVVKEIVLECKLKRKTRAYYTNKDTLTNSQQE